MEVLDSGVLNVHPLLRRGFTSLRLSKVSSGEKHLESIRDSLRAKSIGVYIHVPYCRSTCMFCPYFRGVLRSRDELGAYFNALLREVELYGKALENLSLEVVEVHVGGGTPSIVPPKFYKLLHDKLSEFFNLRTGIGIEVNPEDFQNPEVVEEYHACGVDEVSIGVQSFDERILKSIGRKHKSSDNVRAVENSLKAGFKWVNVDLMFLTPSIKGYVELGLDEKLRAFREDLNEAIGLGVHQVTYYATIIPKNSPGYKLVELGKVNQELDAIDRFVEAALSFVDGRKFYLTRVYSFSREPYEYATVNLEVVGPLLGLGAGAWSNTGYYQYINIHDVNAYIELVKGGRYPAIYGRRLSEDSMVWRIFFDQLSTGRVEYSVLEAHGVKPTLKMKTLLKLMELAGLAKKSGKGYELTERGIIEVYKSVINYVAEVPVKATATLTQYRDLERLPMEVTIS